jgi:hypothetical protein
MFDTVPCQQITMIYFWFQIELYSTTRQNAMPSLRSHLTIFKMVLESKLDYWSNGSAFVFCFREWLLEEFLNRVFADVRNRSLLSLQNSLDAKLHRTN